MEEHEELVRLFVCESELQARDAKQFLEDNGVKVLIGGLDAGGSVFGGAVDDPEIEVFVYQSEFERAKELVEAAMEDEEEMEPIPAWTCKCGEDVDEGFAVCWSCEAIYESIGEDSEDE